MVSRQAWATNMNYTYLIPIIQFIGFRFELWGMEIIDIL